MKNTANYFYSCLTLGPILVTVSCSRRSLPCVHYCSICVSADKMVPLRVALLMAAGGGVGNLGGYRRISFLGVALGEGAKE